MKKITENWKSVMKNHSEYVFCKKKRKKNCLTSQIIIWLQQSAYKIQTTIDTECQTVQFTAIFTVIHST